MDLRADANRLLDEVGAYGHKPEMVERVRKLVARSGVYEHAGDVLAHGDLSFDNLRIADKCRLIDWEMARLAPPEFDLAHAIAETTAVWSGADPGQPLDRLVRILAAYEATSKPDESLAMRVLTILPLVRARCLAWALHAEADQRQASREEFRAERLGRLTELPFLEFVEGLATHGKVGSW